MDDDYDSEDLDQIVDQNKEQKSDQVEPLVELSKRKYQSVFMKALSGVKKGQVLKLLKALPKAILPNLLEPLLLSDFLLKHVGDNTLTLETQVYALKSLFLLLQNNNLDCPEYYNKLYSLLQPQRVPAKNGFKTVSVFTIDDMETKTRFLRLLDLSLRAPTLPSKTIASFLKRLGRVMVQFGEVQNSNDVMFIAALTANLIKRHPRCARLVHRRKTSLSCGLRLSTDPFKADETDALKTFAMKSSLWEMEIVMRQHFDQRVRDFLKLFKQDFLHKTNMFKPEDFVNSNHLDVLKQDLDDLDVQKETQLIKKNIMKNHGQFKDTKQSLLGKRFAD